MDYNQTVDWLFSRLPMYQNMGRSAYKKDLQNIHTLCDYLGNPQDKLETIHVAGTNGKGSTSHMLASVLQEAGYNVGLHTSPHLKDFRERSRINGELMTEEFVIEFVEQHKNFIQTLGASFFEVSVAMGFQYFAQNQVDIAIIETGLGGRLDSTNIISPVVSVITNIGKDHTAILGNTLSQIAREKAGIIKPNTPVVIGKYTPETKAVFQDIAEEHKADIYYVQDESLPSYSTDLLGDYQAENIQTAICTLQVLQRKKYAISKAAIQRGLMKVRENTQLRGRWDILQKEPMIVADTAHNPDGIAYIIQQIHNTPYHKLHLVLGFVNDKDVLSIITAFPTAAQFYFSNPQVQRALPVEDLREMVPKDLEATYYPTIAAALSAAKSKATKEDLIYIGGSTFVVAEVV